MQHRIRHGVNILIISFSFQQFNHNALLFRQVNIRFNLPPFDKRVANHHREFFAQRGGGLVLTPLMRLFNQRGVVAIHAVFDEKHVGFQMNGGLLFG